MENNEVLEEITVKITRAFERFPDILFVTLFGSAAKGQMKASSDIDLGIASEKALPFVRKVEISTALSNIVGRNMDIVDLQAVSGVILQEALCSGVIIKKTPQIYATLLRKMWFNQADMMPYTRRILEKHCRRFVHE